MKIIRSFGGIGVACVLTVNAAHAQSSPPKPQISEATKAKAADTNTNPDALVLHDFTKRVDAYMAIHKAAAKDSLPIKETKNPADIKAAQLALAAKIRVARTSARAGDILTLEIRNKFRRLVYPELKGTAGRETREKLTEDVKEKDEGPAKKVTFKVNAAYPEGNALPTTPPNILAALPQLPEELEYRIVEKALILRDVQANTIVDFIPNAIQ